MEKQIVLPDVSDKTREAIKKLDERTREESGRIKDKNNERVCHRCRERFYFWKMKKYLNKNGSPYYYCKGCNDEKQEYERR